MTLDYPRTQRLLYDFAVVRSAEPYTALGAHTVIAHGSRADRPTSHATLARRVSDPMVRSYASGERRQPREQAPLGHSRGIVRRTNPDHKLRMPALAVQSLEARDGGDWRDEQYIAALLAWRDHWSLLPQGVSTEWESGTPAPAGYCRPPSRSRTNRRGGEIGVSLVPSRV